MNLEELESKIKEFIVIAEKFPDYKQKIFEVLLTDYLRGGSKPEEALITAAAPPTPERQKFVIPLTVRAVLQQYNVPEDTIEKLFLIEGSEIQPKFSIKTTVKSEAQMQVALLTALENALHPSGKFEFSVETVRARCKDDYGAYDNANFKAYFKNNAKLFKNLDDEEHVELTTEGKEELAEAILAVAG